MVLPRRLSSRIQAAGRLIQDQHCRVVHEAADDADFLLHALGHFLQLSPGIQLEPRHQLLRPIQALQPAVGRHEFDKAPAGHVVHEGNLPGDIAQIPLDDRGLTRAVQAQYGAAAPLRPDKAHQLPDGGGFPRPVGPQEAEYLALFQGEGDVEHALAPAVILSHGFNFYHAHRVSSLYHWVLSIRRWARTSSFRASRSSLPCRHRSHIRPLALRRIRFMNWTGATPS